MTSPSKGPRILFLDIETAPDVAFVWGVYEQSAIAIKEHWYILSFAAQWMYEGKVFYCGLSQYPGYTRGSGKEKSLLKDLHAILSAADIVVAHNGADFDVRKINARFIAHGFKPPTPYKVVDTKRDLTRVARFSSNRLNWLSKQLGIGSKTQEHMDWSLWDGCMNGDLAAWKRMEEYNRHDVVLLRELYEKLSPWIRQPNANLWIEGEACPNPACGSVDLERRGMSRSKTRSYQRFQCRKCGAWGRSTRSSQSVQITPTTGDIG